MPRTFRPLITVGALKAQLAAFPDDLPVVISGAYNWREEEVLHAPSEVDLPHLCEQPLIPGGTMTALTVTIPVEWVDSHEMAQRLGRYAEVKE